MERAYACGLGIQRQCKLLGVPRSTYYYQPRPRTCTLPWRLDELYLECPFFGSRKMAFELKVNRKRIQRLIDHTYDLYDRIGWSFESPGFTLPANLPAIQ
jgi:hypothetical protein